MKHETPWGLTFRYTAGIIFFLAFVAFLFYARDTARSLVVAAFIAYLINPAVVYLANNTRMSRSAAVNIVYFSSLILLVGVPATLAPIFYDEAKVVFKDLLDLTSQLSALLMQPVQAGNLVFHLEEWGQSLAQLQGAITKPLPKEELYDLQADPQELNNLAADPKFSKELAELRGALDVWKTQTHDDTPAARTPDEFDRETGEPLPGRKRPRLPPPK